MATLADSEARAREALGITGPLPAWAGATVAKYALAARLSPAAKSWPRARARATTADWLPEILAALPEQSSFLSRADIQARILDLALDACYSEPLCPEVRLPAEPVALPALPIHALIFSAFPFVAHELYPLLVDAYIAGLDGGPAFQAVGVHRDWLADGRCRRALRFDAATQGLIEADLDPAPRISSAQVLSLDLRTEQADHRAIAARAGVPLLNPPDGARRLDDKRWTGDVWEQAGLPTPPCLRPAPNATSEATRRALADFLRAHGPRVILKPPDGTEGRDVTPVVLNPDDFSPDLLAALADGTLLCCREHGSVRFADMCGPVRCTVRLNVCWDGARAWAESGYAQVAGSSDGIASAGRGGRIVFLPELWAHLCRPDGARLSPTTADWRRMTALAMSGVEAQARALGDAMPALTGIDLLLDTGADGGLQPVLLEANPRPAGMSHSRLITPDGPTDEPGVTQRLWDVVRKVAHGE